MRRAAAAGLLVVAAAVGLGACGGGGDGDAARSGGRDTDTTQPAGDATDAATYVGLTKRAAIARADAAGVPWRVLREDDEHFLATQDHVPDRVNLEIDDGRVTRATNG